MRFNSDYKVTRRQCPTEKTISPLRGFSHYCGATESIISSYYSLQQETFLLLPSPLQKTTYKKHPLPARPEEESSNPINQTFCPLLISIPEIKCQSRVLFVSLNTDYLLSILLQISIISGLWTTLSSRLSSSW